MEISIGSAGSENLAQVVTAWAALIAALFGPAAGYLAARHQARRTIVSNHRQTWIDGLRGDIAAYLAACTELSTDAPYAKTADGKIPLNARAQLKEAQLLLSRIELRLNLAEPDHEALRAALRDLVGTALKGSDGDFATPRKDVIAKAATVLKREWRVVKSGG